MRFKTFFENLWGTIPSPNPPSQPYWLKGSNSGGAAPMGMGSSAPIQPPAQQQQPPKKMMKKKMKKD